LGTPEAIRRVTYELVEDLAQEHYEYAEIRFAPQYARFTGYSQQEFVEAARDGMKAALAKYPAMKAALILCCMRGDDNKEENMETIRMTAKYLDGGICAADLAGAESLFPTERFADVFALAKKLDVPYTIHAGEAAGSVSGPDSIREALKMGAQRLGHGVLAIQDAVLVRELAARRIALEVSYTSNVQTKAFPTAAEHSLGRLYEVGVHVTINTDNRTVSNVNLAEEVSRVKQAFGFTDGDIEVMQQYAREAAFTRL
ncbi:MAG: adenosine deaminase family protein, partial [Lachnospiraceae bacterium]|nr:adenosine deaminase family protein [Lachnospiraceae bacterium]